MRLTNTLFSISTVSHRCSRHPPHRRRPRDPQVGRRGIAGRHRGPKWGTGKRPQAEPYSRPEIELMNSAAMIMVKTPRGPNGVAATSNLFGDIVSDEASVIPGSIGLSPSASLSGIPDEKNRCNGIYEPIHGSAPDISDKGIVNPIGRILSVAMMCRYSLRLPKEADAIEKAVEVVLNGGVRTKDLSGEVGTKEMGDAVVTELIKRLET
ncbi:Isocitrate/isopropylmalate dehydrogenase-domain-containing protein [Xylaria sp. FL0933]|nr:Isocitrate/isopropylmalate dehydrogenase-domain-containing protein [Xylaria sp. FL0933]